MQSHPAMPHKPTNAMGSELSHLLRNRMHGVAHRTYSIQNCCHGSKTWWPFLFFLLLLFIFFWFFFCSTDSGGMASGPAAADGSTPGSAFCVHLGSIYCLGISSTPRRRQFRSLQQFPSEQLLFILFSGLFRFFFCTHQVLINMSLQANLPSSQE